MNFSKGKFILVRKSSFPLLKIFGQILLDPKNRQKVKIRKIAILMGLELREEATPKAVLWCVNEIRT